MTNRKVTAAERAEMISSGMAVYHEFTLNLFDSGRTYYYRPQTIDEAHESALIYVNSARIDAMAEYRSNPQL